MFGIDISTLAGGAGAIVATSGIVAVGVKKIKAYKEPYEDVVQLINELNGVIDHWRQINSDGRITPQEAQSMFNRIGKLASYGLGIRSTLQKLF
tara:strand:- start:346 stop:627 length:282 start_codon:yes stop_codon:yes gene_type:complete